MVIEMLEVSKRKHLKWVKLTRKKCQKCFIQLLLKMKLKIQKIQKIIKMAYNPSGKNQENQESLLFLKDEHRANFEDRKCCQTL